MSGLAEREALRAAAGSSVTTPGPSATAVGDGLGTAVARMRRSDAQSKVIILLTDGDNNAGSISPDYASHLAKSLGCKVYPIQIGTDGEVDVEDGVDLFGQPRYVPHRFRVNPELLHRIAKETAAMRTSRPTAGVEPADTAWGRTKLAPEIRRARRGCRLLRLDGHGRVP